MIYKCPMLRPLVCFLLSAVITIEPILASEALPTHKPVFQGQSFEGVNYFPRPEASDEKAWSEFLTEELKTAEPTNIEKIAQTNPNLVQLMVAYRDYFARARLEIDRLIATVGEKSFIKEHLDENKVVFHDSILGKMEFTNIDGHPVAKINHTPSGVAFLIYDENEVPRSSKHLQQYLARQHYDAGATRKQNKFIDDDGKKKKVKPGRDTILLSIKTNAGKSEVGVEVAARKRGFKNWWTATYKSPNTRNVMEGFFSGILQSASSYALAEMVSHILPGYVHGDTPLYVAGFTFAYGTMIGIWNSFYQNWRTRGPKFVRDYIKGSAVSFSYYFGVSLITSFGAQELTLIDPSLSPTQVVASLQAFFDSVTFNPAEYVNNRVQDFNSWMAAIGSASALALFAKGYFWHNFVANNELKNVALYLQKIKEIERRDLKVYSTEIPVPYGITKNSDSGQFELKNWNLKISMSQRFINRQIIYYLPVNWAKFLDQVWFGTTIAPTLAGELPIYFPFISMAAFWSTVIASNYWVNWWAYKKHTDAAERLKIKEETGYYFAKYYTSKLEKAYEKTKGLIQGIASRLSTKLNSSNSSTDSEPGQNASSIETNCDDVLQNKKSNEESQKAS